MPRLLGWSTACACGLILQTCASIAVAQVDESKPVFELDCISFAGRFLSNAPVKKKVHPGLAVDGTIWALEPESNKVLVKKTFPGEAAQAAGVEAGDEIISINGYAAPGAQLRELFCSYHMYDAKTMTESLIIQKKDGTQKTLKLQLLTLDKCNADEKKAWLGIYKSLGY